ncbi:MAG: right-handed parallel beta-helix repeat-containing protein [Planctomycetes bacterium]|nr:right-handed parallel beta-helix repeat-containing protein [Planctomycetota bacterium]
MTRMDYNCREFGSKGDGILDETSAIQKAVQACHESGGGRVIVPAGKYMVTSIELLENVELYLERGALLQGIYDSPNYREVDPEFPAKAMIFAKKCSNVAISGAGKIDGQGPRYWRKLDKPRTGRKDFTEVGVSQFWYEHIKEIGKPERIVAFYKCKDVSLTGISITGASAWTCHLVASENVKIHGIDIWNPTCGPNTDGIDIDGSSDILISDCTIHTGDDAIVLKTKNIAKTNHPIRNVTVTNCRLTSGCNAFKIGTETQDDIENICISNCTFYSPEEYELIDRCITGLAFETVDGANVRNVVCSNITMINARTAIFIRRGGWFRGERKTPGVLRGIHFSNIVATGTTYPSVIAGLPGYPVENVRMNNVEIESAPGREYKPVEVSDIPEYAEHYPEVFMFGPAPAAGMFIRHVDGLEASSLNLHFPSPPEAEAIVTDDVRNISINGRA